MIRRSWIPPSRTRNAVVVAEVQLRQERVLRSGTWYGADSQRNSGPLPDATACLEVTISWLRCCLIHLTHGCRGKPGTTPHAAISPKIT